MKNMQHFDNHLKSAFDDYAPDVSQGTWEKIMAERKNRKPVPVWWSLFNGKNILLLAGLLIAGAASIWLYGYFRDIDKKVANKVNHEILIPTDENKIPERNSEKNNIAGNTKNATTNTNLTTSQKDNLLREKLVETTVANDIRQNKNSSNANKVLNQNKLLTSKENANTKNEITTPSNVINWQSTSQVKDNLPKGKIASGGATLSKKKILIVKKLKGKGNFHSEMSEISDNLAGPVTDENFLEQGSLLGRLLFGTEKISASSLINTASAKNAITILPFHDPGCPALEKNTAANKQYWELYAGPDYAIKKYKDTANSAYLQKRKSSTSFQSAFSAGARYTRVFNNGISISTGINYSQVNEKFSFVESNFVQITYITNAAGDTTGNYSTRGTRYKTSYNHYKTADVPLLIGYELGNGRFHANLNAGAVINIYSWQKGDILDTSFQPVNITTGKGISQYGYKTNIGMGFMGALSVYYKLNERLHLLAEPFLRYNFSPMNKDNFSLQERFTTIGLRLGIRVDLK